MESLVIHNPDPGFWKNKKVLITGHTGFKGSWLCLLLHQFGARISGYALDPPTSPNLFELANVQETLYSNTIGNVLNTNLLEQKLQEIQPEIILHLAAQPLVRLSYDNPLLTYQTNVMGTIHLLEAIRKTKSVEAVVIVTSDKCYDIKGNDHAFREDEAMGGFDPYSSSKACAEIVTSAYRNSFFNPKSFYYQPVAIATARAGNVIGGGDWAADRLIPDILQSFSKREKVLIRNPDAVRPWQFVLEPLTGYLLLAEKLCLEGQAFAGPWNFGPEDHNAITVSSLVESMCRIWKYDQGFETVTAKQPHESGYLHLNSEKSKTQLGWKPRWNLEKTLSRIFEFSNVYEKNESIRDLCDDQITSFLNDHY